MRKPLSMPARIHNTEDLEEAAPEEHHPQEEFL